MALNKRIFYATQGVKITPILVTGDTITTGTAAIPGGLQSIGVTTNFNLEKVFQLGQLELYDAIETNPEVEITLNKVFDGRKPLFMMTMGGTNNATSGNLSEFQNNRCNLDLFIHRDTMQGTHSGTAAAKLSCTGLYASSFTYTFPVDGNLTEEVTLVGTNKTWTALATGATVMPSGGVSASGIGRRWKFKADESVFPSGTGGMPVGSPLTNVTVSFDLGREAIYTLGSYEPYLRFVNFPVEISTEITSIGLDGDFINMNDVVYSCTGTGTLTDFPISFVICGEGAAGTNKMKIDLGDKNKLQSVNYSGGDTGGGNVEISYSFTTDNTFTMVVSGSFATDRATVLDVGETIPYTFNN